MTTGCHPTLPCNAKAQGRKDKSATPYATPVLSAPWRLGGLALNSVRAALLVVAVAFLPATAKAQAIEAWVQRYNGPGNGDDWARAMAVDTNGNVFVTGSSDGGYSPDGGTWHDWATVAYSSTGVPLWTNRYTGPNGFQDNANAVAVDNTGNVYVAGSAQVASGESRCTIIKYSSTGVPLWTNQCIPPGYATSGGKSIALDASGNLFVAGEAGQPGTADYLTIKCSGAGVLLWAKTYNGPRNGYDWVNAVAVDASGNVIVTGLSYGGSNLSQEDYATVKYSAAGTLLWVKRYNGPGNGFDEATAVAVDTNGDVYVTGASGGPPYSSPEWSGLDYATLKYSSAGVPLWTNRYNGPANGFDHAMALAVDASGNVCVTGDSPGSGNTDYATIKYSSVGSPLWTNIYNGPGNSSDDASAVAVDSSGNVFVTGDSSTTAGNSDFATIAYLSAGMPLWTNRYNGAGNGSEIPRAMVVDASGNVFVTGSSMGSASGNDFATIKYVTPPIITRQPLSRTNAVGTTASFTVEAMGSLPLGFQWRRTGTNLVDGGNLSGVTTTNLLIANVQFADACGYSVVVTNAYASATSHVAQLTVVSVGRFSNLSYSPVTGLSFVFCDATVGQPYRIQRSPSLAEGSWVDWQSFTYTEPNAFMDLGAVSTTNRFYRAVSP